MGFDFCSSAFPVIYFNNCLVFNEILFYLIFDDTAILIFCNLAENIYGLLVVALE